MPHESASEGVYTGSRSYHDNASRQSLGTYEGQQG